MRGIRLVLVAAGLTLTILAACGQGFQSSTSGAAASSDSASASTSSGGGNGTGGVGGTSATTGSAQSGASSSHSAASSNASSSSTGGNAVCKGDPAAVMSVCAIAMPACVNGCRECVLGTLAPCDNEHKTCSNTGMCGTLAGCEKLCKDEKCFDACRNGKNYTPAEINAANAMECCVAKNCPSCVTCTMCM